MKPQIKKQKHSYHTLAEMRAHAERRGGKCQLMPPRVSLDGLACLEINVHVQG